MIVRESWGGGRAQGKEFDEFGGTRAAELRVSQKILFD